MRTFVPGSGIFTIQTQIQPSSVLFFRYIILLCGLRWQLKDVSQMAVEDIGTAVSTGM